MKNFFLAVTLLALLGLGARDLQAQAYGPYYDPYLDAQYQNYLQWQQYLQYLQQYDPYYELHVMHYQLYLQPFQPYQIYQPCCYAWGVVIPNWSVPIHPGPRRVISPRGHIRTHAGSRSHAGVGTLPSATSPLPRAVSPQSRAIGRK
jgi:hypothetical protein